MVLKPRYTSEVVDPEHRACPVVIRAALCVTVCLLLSGCHPADWRPGLSDVRDCMGRWRVVGCVIGPKVGDEQRKALQLGEALDRGAEIDVDNVVEMVGHYIDSCDPDTVSTLMSYVMPWAGRHDYQDRMRPLVEKCLSSHDPFVRWVGAATAWRCLDRPRIREALMKDFWTVLIRPDPLPWWASTEVPMPDAANAYFFRKQAAWNLSAERGAVIRRLGEHGIQEALPVLEALDPGDDACIQNAKEEALELLRAIEKTQPEKGAGIDNESHIEYITGLSLSVSRPSPTVSGGGVRPCRD